MTIRNLLSSAAIAIAMLGFGPVRAADLDPALEDPVQVMPSLPLSNVLFGSGWYVRGDFGGTQLLQVNPASQGILSIYSTQGFHSYAPGINFTPSHNIGYTASLGGGYAFNRWIRADVVFDFHQPLHSSAYGQRISLPDRLRTDGDTRQRRHHGLSDLRDLQRRLPGQSAELFDARNGYIDLGTWYNVTPYVGAGVGLSFGHYQTASNYFQANGTSYNVDVNPPGGGTYNLYFDRNASGNYYNPAFAAMGGIAIGIYDHVKLDIGYRYLNLGTILGKNVGTQEVRAGLRYMIDN